MIVQKWVVNNQAWQYSKGLGYIVTLNKGCLSTISQLIWLTHNRLQNNDSDRKQEVMTNLNTISLGGGVAHLTHTKGKPWVTITLTNYLGVTRHAHTLPKHKRHSITND